MKKLSLLFAVGIVALTSCITQSQNIIDEVKENFEGISQLEVNGAFCYVEVIGGESQLIDFQGEIKGTAKEGKFKIMHSVDGEKLKVWIESPNSVSGKIDGKLLFKVPKTMAVNISNSSGSAFVSNISSENLLVKTSSGSIKAENIGANVILKSSSGNITASNIEGTSKMHSSSGSQKITNLIGNIDSYASSGKVTIENAKGDVDVKTSSGSIHLATVNGQISATASSGSIHGSDIMIAGTNSFNTSSGSISIDFVNEIEDLSFDLAASSGSLHIGNDKFKKTIKKTSGEILVKGHSSSGSQKYF